MRVYFIALWYCAAISIIFAWITHIVVTIQAKEWLFMIAGALIPPIAVIHGWAVWFGYQWF